MQTATQARSFGEVLAQTFLLVGAGLVVTAIGAIAFASSHSAAWMTFGIGGIGALLSFRLARWACGNLGTPVAALLYLAGCLCNGVMFAPLAALAAAHRELALLVDTSAFATAALFGALAFIAVSAPRLFVGWGGFLSAGLSVLLMVLLLGVLIPGQAFHLAVAGAGILLFCGYVLYDVSSIVEGQVTNPVQGAIEVYLDVMNLFVYILDLLVRLKGTRDEVTTFFDD